LAIIREGLIPLDNFSRGKANLVSGFSYSELKILTSESGLAALRKGLDPERFRRATKAEKEKLIREFSAPTAAHSAMFQPANNQPTNVSAASAPSFNPKARQ
jgi:hypothetical protein